MRAFDVVADFIKAYSILKWPASVAFEAAISHNAVLKLSR